jgi:hypothetical protein
MPLHCPFCSAGEDERVSAIDSEGKKLVLVMFDCPFSYRFPEDEMRSDDILQKRLDEWRKKDGDAWLESLGPIIRARELRGIERFQKALQAG